MYSWKEECAILQKLEACLENPASCEEAAIEKSALKMKRVDGTWQLVDGKMPQEWNEVFQVGEGILPVIQWANKYLKESKGKMGYEEAILVLAKEYLGKLAEISSKAKTSK